MSRLAPLAILLCLCASLAPGQDNQRFAQFEGKVLILRNFYHGKNLRYDATGTLTDGGKPGSWVPDAMVLIKKVSVDSGRVVFIGERRHAFFLDGHVKADIHGRGKVTIDVAVDPNDDAIKQALQNIFLAPGERVEDFIPYLCANQSGSAAPTPLNHASAPRAIFVPDPAYSEAARAEKVQGIAILSLTVGVDGKASSVCVVRPLGYGLDEEAVETLQRWRFQPALKDGQPVPIRINVEVNFRLY
jgi:TonB family protein